MSDNRVRDGYPPLVSKIGDTEGDEGNPGVPDEVLLAALHEDVWHGVPIEEDDEK